MPEHEDIGPQFLIHVSQSIANVLLQIQRQAIREGRGQRVLIAIRQLYQKLQQDPYDVGEPLYRLTSLRMQCRTAVVRPLVVDFAILEDQPIVFIKGVKLLSTPES